MDVREGMTRSVATVGPAHTLRQGAAKMAIQKPEPPGCWIRMAKGPGS